ncbi:class I SAM-dependent DNA methyltransferase, partial [bacterium]|nr:class I SAM-dependent DNA methyltransferase [bacterium]
NSLRPNWIVVCNFQEFQIYDMEKPQGEPVQVLLEDLPDKFECLQFMVNPENNKIDIEAKVSLKAGELVGKLYDALIKEYINPDENSFRSLNILCVRIVFCLYAEDAGLFETRTAFEDYIKSFSIENLRRGLMDLFKILNTKPENRDKYDTKINSFPYVNGGLFADDTIEIPNFTKEIVDILVNHCAPFDWSKISPTIFGAVFESTLNPETRRKGGMHYTSIANIHKVIDPLFLDDLRHEFSSIVGTRSACPQKNSAREPRALRQKLEQFRNKIASLKFLDPACGSGNFLTETYISLRRLENEILKIIHGNQQLLGSDFSPIKVKISQFYGIEINDFAVTVAKTALWIAESQMMKETEEIVDEDLDFLPLSTSATIVEGNALRMDWRYLCEEEKIPTIKAKKTNLIYEVREPEVKYEAINLITDEINVGKPQQKKSENHYDYIMGNPPFVGYSYQSKEQKNDIFATCCNKNGVFYKGIGKIDYVAGWYFKTAAIIQGTDTKAAFVSTNSITQGEQVAALWKPLFSDYNIKIDFAWRTFRWANETSDKKNMAAVHCVIIGFSCRNHVCLPAKNRHSEHSEESQRCFAGAQHDEKRIFNADGTVIEAKNINGYLLDAPNIWVESRAKSLCDVPQMTTGNRPTDGGNLIIENDDYETFIKKEPNAKKYIKKLLGSEEFINNKIRWCLWLVNATPAEIKRMPEVYKRVQQCKAAREASPDAGRRKLAETPALFREINNPETFLLVPKVSSERRLYIPIGFFDSEIISTDLNFIVSDATLYHFGVLTSSVHNAWMRAVCGRLKSDYRYSKDIVYNNFPWCNPTDTQKAKIEQTAQAILDARAKYPDSSLADLYDETTMPPDLRKAHKENDKAVMAAYGFSQKMSEAEIVAELFKMYEKLAKKK